MVASSLSCLLQQVDPHVDALALAKAPPSARAQEATHRCAPILQSPHVLMLLRVSHASMARTSAASAASRHLCWQGQVDVSTPSACHCPLGPSGLETPTLGVLPVQPKAQTRQPCHTRQPTQLTNKNFLLCLHQPQGQTCNLGLVGYTQHPAVCLPAIHWLAYQPHIALLYTPPPTHTTDQHTHVL